MQGIERLVLHMLQRDEGKEVEASSVFLKKVGVLILPIALQNLINVGISSIDVLEICVERFHNGLREMSLKKF